MKALSHLAGLAIALAVYFSISQSFAAERHGLILTMSDYTSAKPLLACRKDAATMQEVFGKIGVSVHGDRAFQNLDVEEMDRVIHDFARKLQDNDEAYFYFSGHGLEMAGVNYLLPVNFDARYSREVKRQAISLQSSCWKTRRPGSAY